MHISARNLECFTNMWEMKTEILTNKIVLHFQRDPNTHCRLPNVGLGEKWNIWLLFYHIIYDKHSIKAKSWFKWYLQNTAEFSWNKINFPTIRETHKHTYKTVETQKIFSFDYYTISFILFWSFGAGFTMLSNHLWIVSGVRFAVFRLNIFFKMYQLPTELHFGCIFTVQRLR